MKRTLNVTLTTLLLVVLSIFVTSEAIAASPQISFTTTVNVEIVPDKDSINLNIMGEGATAEEAKSAYSKAETDFNMLITEQKLPKKNITTNNINSYNTTDINNNEKFYFSKNTTVVFFDIKKAEMFLEAVTRISNITINSNTLSISNPSKFEEDLLKKASKGAKARAFSYAKNLGYKKARLVKLSEGSVNNFPVPIYAVAKDVASSPSIDPGTSQLSLTITTTWLLS